MGCKVIIFMSTDIHKFALALIQAQNTMTLATANNNIAWSAPVYYAFAESAFYFFSNPDSRHIQETLSSCQASSSIFADSNTWEKICGIQMSGRVKNIPAGRESGSAIHAYFKKFPFVKSLFSIGQSFDLESFTIKNRVKLYRFKPDIVYYNDNQIKFGFRKQIVL